MRLYATYTPCAISSREQTGNIITFVQSEEGILLSETRNNAESGDESDDDSIMPPLLSKEGTDAIDYCNESDHDPISTEMLGYICDGSQSHPNLNRRETRYKIRVI